jgi:hypothetical protein
MGMSAKTSGKQIHFANCSAGRISSGYAVGLAAKKLSRTKCKMLHKWMHIIFFAVGVVRVISPAAHTPCNSTPVQQAA